MLHSFLADRSGAMLKVTALTMARVYTLLRARVGGAPSAVCVRVRAIELELGSGLGDKLGQNRWADSGDPATQLHDRLHGRPWCRVGEAQRVGRRHQEQKQHHLVDVSTKLW